MVNYRKKATGKSDGMNIEYETGGTKIGKYKQVTGVGYWGLLWRVEKMLLIEYKQINKKVGANHYGPTLTTLVGVEKMLHKENTQRN